MASKMGSGGERDREEAPVETSKKLELVLRLRAGGK